MISIPHECLIVYDFDEDNTLLALDKAALDCQNIRTVKNRYGRGVLNAIKTGFDVSTYETLLVTMADLSDDLGAVEPMFDLIENGAAVVCGSRYMPGGRQIGGPLIKRLLSRWAGLSLYYLLRFPVHDLTNSFKMYSRDVLASIAIESTGGFEVGMEIVIKAHLVGFRVAEVPTVWRDREAGKSHFKLLHWIPKYAYWYAYALIHTIRQGKRHATARPATDKNSDFTPNDRF
jgi:glycosyltransferase involved in cell wall biosynthesis